MVAALADMTMEPFRGSHGGTIAVIVSQGMSPLLSLLGYVSDTVSISLWCRAALQGQSLHVVDRAALRLRGERLSKISLLEPQEQEGIPVGRDISPDYPLAYTPAAYPVENDHHEGASESRKEAPKDEIRGTHWRIHPPSTLVGEPSISSRFFIKATAIRATRVA